MNNIINYQFLLPLIVVGPLLFWGVWIVSEESFDGLNSHLNSSLTQSGSKQNRFVSRGSLSTSDIKPDLEIGLLGGLLPKQLQFSEVNARGARHLRKKLLPIIFLAIFISVLLVAAIIFYADEVIPKLFAPLLLGTALALYLRNKGNKEIDQISKTLESEIPTQIQLLTILVSSGMSPARAISTLADRSDSVSALAFRTVVSRIEEGYSLVEALDELKSRHHSNSLRRFITSLVLGIERGSSLAPILIAQVRDARLARKTEIMQKAGKAEIGLMIPVVFLILPISILFALWPSYEQLGAFL